jgi:hypothetical protein
LFFCREKTIIWLKNKIILCWKSVAPDFFWNPRTLSKVVGDNVHVLAVFFTTFYFFDSNWMMLVSFIGTFASLFGLMWKRQETPTNYILLAVFVSQTDQFPKTP